MVQEFREPDPEIEFAIYGESGDFIPRYYPKRFNITTGKKLERNAASCEGQRVSVEELKNSELHVTGKVLSNHLDDLDRIAHSTRPVEVITPVLESGGMMAWVKSCERGELSDYDYFAEDWRFDYTIDLVSTGKDEYDKDPSSRYER